MLFTYVGQAQHTCRRVLDLLRGTASHRRPATDGDRGRERHAPEAARNLPRDSIPPQPAPPAPSSPTDPALRAILDALVEIRDSQLDTRER